MTSSVPIADKQQFVRWFLKNFQLKRREGVWILNYLLSNDNIMNNIHFVEDAHYCPRAIIMSTIDHDGIPFRFYKQKVMSTDAEKSFHDLRLNPDEKMYIQLNFPNTPPKLIYLAVLEENPYLPQNIYMRERDRLMAEEMMGESLYTFQRDQLLAEIDTALDEGNKEKFLQLTTALQTLEAENK